MMMLAPEPFRLQAVRIEAQVLRRREGATHVFGAFCQGMLELFFLLPTNRFSVLNH